MTDVLETKTIESIPDLSKRKTQKYLEIKRNLERPSIERKHMTQRRVMLKINDIKLYRSDSKWKLQKEQLDKVQRRCCYTSES